MVAVFWWELWTAFWRSTRLLLPACWATGCHPGSCHWTCLCQFPPPFEISRPTTDQMRSSQDLQWLEFCEKWKVPGAELGLAWLMHMLLAALCGPNSACFAPPSRIMAVSGHNLVFRQMRYIESVLIVPGISCFLNSCSANPGAKEI